VIESDHDGHLSKQLFMIRTRKSRFFYLFSRSKDSCVSGLNLTNCAKTAFSDLIDDDIIFQIVLFLHFDEGIPFYLNCFHIISKGGFCLIELALGGIGIFIHLYFLSPLLKIGILVRSQHIFFRVDCLWGHFREVYIIGTNQRSGE
jgi:hypothetical protein